MKANLTEDRTESLRFFVVRMMLVMKVIMLSFLSYLTRANLQMAMGRSDGAGFWPLVFIVAVFVALGVMLMHILHLVSHL